MSDSDEESRADCGGSRKDRVRYSTINVRCRIVYIVSVSMCRRRGKTNCGKNGWMDG